MAEPLKNAFDRALVRRIAEEVAGAWPAFPRERFVREATRGLASLELLDRGRHVAAALARALPPHFPQAIAILGRSLSAPLERTDGHGMTVFRYLPHSTFVETRGLGHVDLSLDFLHELTRRFTGEFAIRPFLDRHPRPTFARLRIWARDPDEHVRRLVSEGTRPRLPWARRVPRLIEDPAPGLALLERLRDDPSEYVRRSVANHLNDVSRDHPELVLTTCERWLEGGVREELVRHALRTLVRRADPRALALLGAGDAAGIDVAATVAPRRARLGGSFLVDVRVRSRRRRTLLLDLVVFYPRPRGETRKVFRLRRGELAAGEPLELRHTVRLVDLSTRKHHPGRHRLELQLNGRNLPIGEVLVR